MTQAIILADDLTGAADTGVAFSRAGLSTLLSLKPGLPNPRIDWADVVISLTRSRHSSETTTIRRNQIAARHISRLPASHQPRWIYQKIDSTLRGYVAASLAATLSILNLDSALVAPAFPVLERTTLNGHQLVQGKRLAETEFRAEVAEGHLPTLFQTQMSDRQVSLIPLERVKQGSAVIAEIFEAQGPGIYIADATTDDDLRNLTRAAEAAHIQLLCGSSGLAHALVETYPFQSLIKPPASPRHNTGPILIVAGTRHPATIRQIRAAQTEGIPIIQPANEGFPQSDTWIDETIEAAKRQLAQHQVLILTTMDLQNFPDAESEIATKLGKLVQTFIEDVPLGALVLTGGDIALSVCDALHAKSLHLQLEIEPGIAEGWLVDGSDPGLPVVTKAGGFGNDHTLLTIIQQLQSSL